MKKVKKNIKQIVCLFLVLTSILTVVNIDVSSADYSALNQQECFEELHNYIYSFGGHGNNDYYIAEFDTTYDNSLKYIWKANHSETSKTYRIFCMVHTYGKSGWNVIQNELFSIFINTDDVSVFRIEYINYGNGFSVESHITAKSFLCTQIPNAEWVVTTYPTDTNINTSYIANTRLKYFYPEFNNVLNRICGITLHGLGLGAHDYNALVKQATSVNYGYTKHICSCCSSEFVDNYTAPTGKPAGLKVASRTATAQKFTWTKTSGVTGYQIQLLNSANKQVALNATTANAFAFSKLAAGTLYKARVRFYIKAADGKNYYSPWSTTLNSPTLPKGTALKLTTAKKAFTTKWTKIGGVTGYQVQYATNAKFSKAVTKTVKGASKYSLAVKSLKGGAKYYVRVRTYKTIGGKNYVSVWSAAKAVKTKK